MICQHCGWKGPLNSFLGAHVQNCKPRNKELKNVDVVSDLKKKKQEDGKKKMEERKQEERFLRPKK